MKTIQPYSKAIVFKALDCLEVHIDLQETSEEIPLNRLFEVGVRKNKKRIFLFISKVLGKHLAVDPYMTRIGGVLLAEAYYKKQTGKAWQENKLLELFKGEELPKESCEEVLSVSYPLDQKTLFIGFAETATGLGHSMFSAFDETATFIHTTREPIISEAPTFVFEEEHSHATGHRCYTENPDFFKGFSRIVLVDDEITTGNTALNLIEALHEKSGAKAYSVVALLDWRNEMQKEKARFLAEKLDVTIEFISVIQGCIEPVILKPLSEEAMETKSILNELEVIEEETSTLLEDDREGNQEDNEQVQEQPLKVKSINTYAGEKSCYETLQVSLEELIQKTIKSGDGRERSVAYMKANGRFGLDAKENKTFEKHMLKLGTALRAYRNAKSTLCIGTEEFIYVPAMIACAMGEGIRYQSTTRSPIMTAETADYPLHTALAYKRPEDETVINYIYNILPGVYDEIFWFMERDVAPGFKQMMLKALGEKGIKKIYFVCCDGKMEENL